MSDLLLAIEVASPGSPFLDYQIKRRVYLEAGVREYWVVGVEARNVTRWRGVDDPGAVITDRIEWHPRSAGEPFVMDLPTLFDEALR